MQAIILAAGFGSRLRPLTDTKPKALVPVNGTPLLHNALNCLAATGAIDQVVIVIGYMGHTIMESVGSNWKGMKITYVENDIYAQTNNVYSLYLARDFVRQDTVLLECDLYYTQELIDTIVSGDADCNILVSPYDENTMDGTVILAGEDNKARALVIRRDQEGVDLSKALKTVNLYRFKQHFLADKLMPAIELYVRTGSVNSYYELVLGSLIYFGNDDIRVTPISPDHWREIDDWEDLKRAEEHFAK